MKTHGTAFFGLLPAFSSHNTLTPAGLPKPHLLSGLLLTPKFMQ